MDVKAQATIRGKIDKIRQNHGLPDTGFGPGLYQSQLEQAGRLIGKPCPRLFAKGAPRYNHKFHQWFKRNAKQIKFLYEAGML